MERERISVIIPIYKVEQYLDKCVRSVLAQTYEDLEIILVDDGSPDGCGELCDEYARQDSRVKVIHKPNGGLSSARNAGLDVATGAYIGFVDSDDYIREDMYETLYQAIRSSGADMVLCDYLYVDEQGSPVRELPPFPGETLTPEQAYRRMTLDSAAWRYVTAWNRLYRRELFDGLRFPEGKCHEDEFLAHRLYERCRAAVTVPRALYYYVQRGDSIMNVAVSMRQLDRVQARFERYMFFREKGQKEFLAPTLRRCYEFLWEVMDSVDVGENREALRPWVAAVAARYFRRLDIRGAWLWLGYLRKCRGSKP